VVFRQRHDSYAWTYGTSPSHKLIKAKACSIWLDDGKEYLDLTSGGSHFAILGHSNDLVKQSIVDIYEKYSHFDIKTLDLEEVSILSDLILSDAHLNSSKYRIFFSGCNGADANEAAIRLAFQAQWNRGFISKKWIISRTQSYHGMSADALALSDRNNLNQQKSTLSPFRSQIPQHHPIYAAYQGISAEQYLNDSIAHFKESIFTLGAENIAAFLGETILGGLIGDVPPLANYWKEIHAICQENNIYLILDEVYCGTGTSGTYHACQQDDCRPDFLTMGKTLCGGGAPLSAVLISEDIYSLALGVENRLQFSNTFQGHVLGLASSLAVQSTVLSHGFISEVSRKGSRIMSELSANLSSNDLFVNIRGRGLRISLEFSCERRNDFANDLHSELLRRGIFNTCKWHRLSITPPLIINDDQIDFLIATITSAFNDVSVRYKPQPISYEWLSMPTPTR